MTKTLFGTIIVFVLLTMTSTLIADPVKWYLQDVKMTDGGRIIGSYVFDADTGVYSDIDVASTAGTAWGNTLYGDPNPGSSGNSGFISWLEDAQANSLVGQGTLAITLVGEMTNDGGILNVDRQGFNGEGDCALDNLGRECGNIIFARKVATGYVTTNKPGVELTAGFSGAWFNSSTSGQGILLDIYPKIPLAFLAWFTYDLAGAGDGTTAVVGHQEQRWLTAQGTFRGNEAVLDLVLTTDGVFNDPASVINSPSNSYGRIVLTFGNDCATGKMEFELFEQEIEDVFAIQRLSNDNVDLCMHVADEHTPPKPAGSIVFTSLIRVEGSPTLSNVSRMNPDGGNRVALFAPEQGAGGDPVSSPDGTKVAFTRDSTIFIMDADGSNKTALQEGRFPDFSPDGNLIVYSNSNVLKVMDINGFPDDAPNVTGDMPAWSPDGSRIVYRNGGNIWVVNMDDVNINLTSNPAGTFASSPRWSPDGKNIAFEQCADGFCHIMLMEHDGDNIHNLTSGPVSDFLPDWSPDG